MVPRGYITCVFLIKIYKLFSSSLSPDSTAPKQMCWMNFKTVTYGSQRLNLNLRY